MASGTSKGSAPDETEGTAVNSLDAAATEAVEEDCGDQGAMPSFTPIGDRVAWPRVAIDTGVAAAPARTSASPVATSRSPLSPLLAAIFAMGVAAGLGGAYLAPLDLPMAKDGVQAVQRTLFSRQSRHGDPDAAMSSGNGTADAISASATAVDVERRNGPVSFSLEGPAREKVAPAIAPNPAVPATDPLAGRAASGPGHADMSADRPVEREANADPSPTSLRPLDSVIPDAQAAPADAAREAQGSASDTRAAAASQELAATAMARASEAMAQGDIVTARRFYEFAFSSGIAGAAGGVGSTYDPMVLKENGVAGLKGDAETAKRWYEKAIAAGDARAKSRLAKLRGPSAAH